MRFAEFEDLDDTDIIFDIYGNEYEFVETTQMYFDSKYQSNRSIYKRKSDGLLYALHFYYNNDIKCKAYYTNKGKYTTGCEVEKLVNTCFVKKENSYEKALFNIQPDQWPDDIKYDVDGYFYELINSDLTDQDNICSTITYYFQREKDGKYFLVHTLDVYNAFGPPQYYNIDKGCIVGYEAERVDQVKYIPANRFDYSK